MRKVFVTILVISIFIVNSKAQPKPLVPPLAPAAAKEDKDLPNLVFNADNAISSDHEATIKGQRVPYKATAGTMPVWDEEGKCIAGLFYTYYERSDVKDRASRPLVILSMAVPVQLRYGCKLLIPVRAC